MKRLLVIALSICILYAASVSTASADYTPPLTTLGMSQVRAALSQAQASNDQACVDQLTAYLTRFKNAQVGMGPPPGPMPQCQANQEQIRQEQIRQEQIRQEQIRQEQANARQAVTITTAAPSRTSGKLHFMVTTSSSVSRVVLAWDNGTATMISSNGKNWSASVPSSKFSPNNDGYEAITVRAYPMNSMTAVTKIMNVSIPDTPATQNAEYIFPVKGKNVKHITNKEKYANGTDHKDRWDGNGVDIPAPAGTAVVATKSGTVTTSMDKKDDRGNYISFGKYIVIKHDDETESLYAHLSSRYVGVGAKVKAGQTIGSVGSTGKSDINHLHFELSNAKPYKVIYK